MSSTTTRRTGFRKAADANTRTFAGGLAATLHDRWGVWEVRRAGVVVGHVVIDSDEFVVVPEGWPNREGIGRRAGVADAVRLLRRHLDNPPTAPATPEAATRLAGRVVGTWATGSRSRRVGHVLRTRIAIAPGSATEIIRILHGYDLVADVELSGNLAVVTWVLPVVAEWGEFSDSPGLPGDYDTDVSAVLTEQAGTPHEIERGKCVHRDAINAALPAGVVFDGTVFRSLDSPTHEAIADAIDGVDFRAETAGVSHDCPDWTTTD
ncbi:hypothetical protein [Actinokineospora terrae]|uniref:Uncharacterized protein n=1 Tax=Actinokineospora terrae TaxID=155974 RepID=A0A1H9M7Y3_9PSEU|nr:hypothetical protein [Actinokineospora terrae]SER19860.1 hypothetical protein SAMN04487818_10215 [Actinokineospora terrae]